MSNIKTIDELRRVVGLGKAHYYPTSKDYYDAIDECVDAIDREISERYMELPVDAEGVPIRVGDCLQLGDTRGEVVALTYCPANGKLPWEWQCDTGDWYNTAFAYHVKPRTIEDVLREFAEDVYASHADFISIDGENAYLLAAINETADEIRELTGVS